ncbi:hypothetical protein CPB86DRAFT_776198 [Serendipita vermifera]|nr:hypothetical protein CPB86DRAFT_776198 [Serendipita vermifera]
MPERHRLSTIPRKASPTNQAYVLGGRGRGHERSGSSSSRSSSSDSHDLGHYDDPDSTRHYGRHVPPSPFDARARQRTAPVEPPSSWAGKRPAPAGRRRRSDAGSNYGGSDNESSYGYGYGNGRRRTSNPVSPSTSYQESGMHMPPHRRQGSRQGSVPPDDRRYGSRPHSRAHSNSSHHNISSSYRPESPDAVLVQYPDPEVNTVPMPRAEGETQEEGDGVEDQDRDLIPDPRLSMISFTSSIGDKQEQLEALQKALAETTRRAAEQERSLQEQLTARELDIDDIQAQLENTREMIATLRRDEKEWRSKERHYVSQVNSLEADVNRLQRSLESAKAAHQTLAKQHAEQTAEADKNRGIVRAREKELRELEHLLMTTEHEVEKARADAEMTEEQIKQLQTELAKANQVHADYLAQKQENVILKETIDRLRFDLDDLRSAHAAESSKGGSSAPGSAMASLSRTLGSELLRRLNPHEEEGGDESDSETTVDETVEEKVQNTDGDEAVIQTIITRKRKIVGKSHRGAPSQETHLVDAGTQYESELFKRICGVQTDTEDDYKPIASTSRAGMQVKVEPPSPSSRLLQLPRDDPPSYQLSELEQSGEETLEILRKWHGVKVLGPLPGGISREAIEDWHTLKRELGIKCPIIEEIIEQSDKQSGRSKFSGFGFSPIKGESAKRYVEGGKRRFYNIYNTYILGSDRASVAGSSSAEQESTASSNALNTGKWVVAFGAWSAFLLWYGSGGDLGSVFGTNGPTYADKTLWASFNALAGVPGEGFGVAGTAPPVDTVGAVWFVVEKLVRGATDLATRRVVFPS